MASCANSLKLGGELGRGRLRQAQPSRRPLFWAMVVAIAVALAASTWMILELSYEHGNLNLRGTVSREAPYRYVESLMRYPSELHLWGWVNMGLGAAIMLGLTVARWHYAWWPLHPLGYLSGRRGLWTICGSICFGLVYQSLGAQVRRCRALSSDEAVFYGPDFGATAAGRHLLSHRPFYRHGRQCDFLGVNRVATAGQGYPQMDADGRRMGTCCHIDLRTDSLERLT